jgi:hypothetical protein
MVVGALLPVLALTVALVAPAVSTMPSPPESLWA